MRSLSLALDYAFLKSGVETYIDWQPFKHPHCVVFGGTGSGKTYFVKLLLARIGKYSPEAEVVVCDFKADADFDFLHGLQGYFCFDDCTEGIDLAVARLKARQNGADAERSFFLLMFDEWASYLNFLDKKASEEARKKLSLLLMLGRSFNIHILLSQQRLDAACFQGGSRDNFSVVIGLGRLSKEAVDMMFSDFKDVVDRQKNRGEGTLLLGNELYDIVVPQITKSRYLEHCIRHVVGNVALTKESEEKGLGDEG